MSTPAELSAKLRDEADSMLEWSATGDDTQVGETLRKAADCMDSLQAQVEGLADPVVVHVNMLRGGIAKPSLRSMLHVYGVLEAFERTVEIAARNEASPFVEKVRAALSPIKASDADRREDADADR